MLVFYHQIHPSLRITDWVSQFLLLSVLYICLKWKETSRTSYQRIGFFLIFLYMSMSLSILLFCPSGFFLICMVSGASLFVNSFIWIHFNQIFLTLSLKRKRGTFLLKLGQKLMKGQISKIRFSKSLLIETSIFENLENTILVFSKNYS